MSLAITPFVFGRNTFGGGRTEKRLSFDVLDPYVGAKFQAIGTVDRYSHWGEGNGCGDAEKDYRKLAVQLPQAQLGGAANQGRVHIGKVGP